jgi:hypothetical protein
MGILAASRGMCGTTAGGARAGGAGLLPVYFSKEGWRRLGCCPSDRYCMEATIGLPKMIRRV